MNVLEPADSVDVHDPQMTAVRAARLLAEFARALNYATLPHDPRLEFPSDVFMILGELQAALSRLPQACDHLAFFLQRQRDAGVLYAEREFPHAGNPPEAVAYVVAELRQAAIAANTAGTALGRAQTGTSGLAQIEPAPSVVHPSRPRTAHPTTPDAGRGF